MQKINWENGELIRDAYVTIDNIDYSVTPEEISGNTPLDADNLNLMQDYIEEAITKKDIITANLTSDVTKSSTGDYLVNSLTASAQIGNKLSISDGDIVIGSGVKKVMVSGVGVMIAGSNTGNKIRNFTIVKNSTNLKTVSGNFDSGEWVSLTLAPCIVSVASGDRLKLQMYSNATDVIKGGTSYTYITVEVVEYEED